MYTTHQPRITLTQWRLKLKITSLLRKSTMSEHSSPATDHQEPDAIEEIVPVLPIVLPIVGGVLMFLLAFIAVKMA
jgi:hypothetical protein